jgi:hypothetical protein
VASKLQAPERRFDSLGFVPGDFIICTALDPDLHHAGIATVTAYLSAGGPQSMALRSLEVAKAHRGLKGERAVIYQARQVKALIETQFLLARTQAPARPRVGYLLVVEDQGVWSGSTECPKDIIRLAQVAGSAMGARPTPDEQEAQLVYVPEYSEWAGSLKDGSIFQARAWRAVGEPLTTMEKRAPSDPYIVPRTIAKGYDFNDGDYKHLGDAVGMAVWGLGVCFRA